MTLSNAKKTIFVAVLAIGLLGSSTVFTQPVSADVQNKGKNTINHDFFTFDNPEIRQATEIMEKLNKPETTPNEKTKLITELTSIKQKSQGEFKVQQTEQLMKKKNIVSNYVVQTLETLPTVQMRNDLPIIGLYVDEQRDALVIHVDSMEFSDKKAKRVLKQVRSLVGEKIDVIIEPSYPIIPQMCSQTGNCEPAQAGVKISTPDGPCSIGFKATYAGKTGFVSAGHCTWGSSGDGVGQPNYVWWDHIGTVYDNSYQRNSKYDGMFVNANENISDKVYYNKDISYAGHASYLDGVIMEGHVSKGVSGVVLNNSYDGYVGSIWIKDMAISNYVGQGGDSGAVVYGLVPSSHLLGTHSGYNGYFSAFSKQQNITTEFPGLVWNFN